MQRLLQWRLTPLKIVASYALVGALWILLSDALVGLLFSDPATITLASTAKGWAYVSVTALLLYGLISRSERALRERAVELIQLQQEAQAERSRLATLIQTAPIGIVFHSAPGGGLLISNRAAESILGRPLVPNIPLDDQPAYAGLCDPSGEAIPIDRWPMVRALRDDVAMTAEVLVCQPSGQQASVLVNSAPIHDETGEVIGSVAALLDISPIREQEALRDQFISAAAHELKTPVTTVKGYAQLLRKWVPPDDGSREAQALSIIDIQCDRISRRVQEMLDAVRHRTTTRLLHVTRFDLGELAALTAERMRATSALHRFTVERCEAMPVDADREHIEEVIVSLLDNAVKFSPEGGDICVRAWANTTEVLVSVGDQGVGIPSDRLPFIFEPFYEPVPSGAPGYQGVVGLGLYLSKLNVERHEGRIWVESEEGCGSTFYFALPLSRGR